VIGIRDTRGAIKIMSSDLIIKKVISTDVSTTISVHVEDQTFVEFINRLETEVFNVYQRGNVDRHLLNDTNDFNMSIEEFRMNIVNGRSITQTSKGDPINTKEDLVPGNTIRILFTVLIDTTMNNRYIKIHPKKIIKYITDAEYIESTVAMSAKGKETVPVASSASSAYVENTYDIESDDE
jgi:hypothetical protein